MVTLDKIQKQLASRQTENSFIFPHKILHESKELVNRKIIPLLEEIQQNRMQITMCNGIKLKKNRNIKCKKERNIK